MNGALVVAAVVAVIEIGSPVASNLGLSVGPTSTAGQVAESQILQNAAVPSWQQAPPSVATANSPGSAVAVPYTAEALASNVTSEVGPSLPTPTSAAHAVVAASPNVAATPAHAPAVAAAIVSLPGRAGGAAAVSAGAQASLVGSGSQHGNGQQGQAAGRGLGHDASPGQGGGQGDGGGNDTGHLPPGGGGGNH